MARLIHPTIFFVLFALLGTCLSALARDPLDRFEVLHIVRSVDGETYAGIYRYHHANSSSTVTAVWIGKGQPPSAGSQDVPRGAPALIWTGSPDELALSWRPGKDRPSAQLPAGVEQSPKHNDCYFEYDSVRRVCFDAAQIAVTITP
jgi:hypothetical protein